MSTLEREHSLFGWADSWPHGSRAPTYNLCPLRRIGCTYLALNNAAISFSLCSNLIGIYRGLCRVRSEFECASHERWSTAALVTCAALSRMPWSIDLQMRRWG